MKSVAEIISEHDTNRIPLGTKMDVIKKVMDEVENMVFQTDYAVWDMIHLTLYQRRNEKR